MSMRELIINFVDDGEVFHEIDEKRNYFLVEAEKVVEKVRVRLANEKRVASPKGFEFWIDGVQLIVTSVRFENGDSLEEQIKTTIMGHGGWGEETKHKYINKINDYVNQERELMSHREFKAFATRLDQYMGNPSVEPFPLLLSLTQMKSLFDGVFVSVSAGFYSELEELMFSIKQAFQTVVANIHKELLQVDVSEYEGDGTLQDFLKVRTVTWLGDGKKFNQFKNFVVAHYGSVSQSRVHALYPKFKPYQELQKRLFVELADVWGFRKTKAFSEEIVSEFVKGFEENLFEGFVISTDEMVESVILSPVVRKFEKEFEHVLARAKKEQVEEKDEELMDDVGEEGE